VRERRRAHTERSAKSTFELFLSCGEDVALMPCLHNVTRICHCERWQFQTVIGFYIFNYNWKDL